MLETLVTLLAGAVLLVPLTRRAGFGSILGYLVAGAVIGPAGLRLVTDVETIRQVSELGIVMLLFLIGLELRPRRLWVMRRSVFGLGTAQVGLSAAALALPLALIGLSWTSAIVLGAGLALSSTAIVLPMLAERELLGLASGRDSFAVLLFQDLAFIPLIALVPLLAGQSLPDHLPWLSVAKAVAGVALILVGGSFLVPQLFRVIGGARTPEVFTAASLLTVAGAGAIAHAVGLSTSLGAFLAGVLLSDSEYRHELEADIKPFEGLLLGFFFISVGMSANLGLAVAEPGRILLGLIGLIAIKAAVCFMIGRLSGQPAATSVRFALALPQGSEFSFVLSGVAVAAGALSEAAADEANLVAALSMAATPLIFALSERFVVPRLTRPPEPVYDAMRDEGAPVIICGFGRMGQIVGRVLRMRGIPFVALEKDSEQVEVLRRFGSKVYFGDPARPDLLRAAGAANSRLLVNCLADIEENLALVDAVQRNFPNLQIVSRARNRRHAHLLIDRGVKVFVRETFHSSLRLTEHALTALGVSQAEARRAVEIFRQHDEQTLIETHPFYDDEQQVIQSAKQAAAELTRIFEADQERGAGAKAERSAV
ncbi:monovalent cation:proton antiporter-2 (CPA2) family protein [Enterovirga aerilata]|uniref:Glutathione-regulated potassium-efflux system protein KefB n=1 Tax=Enterovirga aerilata TaxID=2730920 RepID=A0A849I5Q3_9HYPH|nr:monovalent cation:proton antiporter-2 (CPA2) family protein [Enterovirga sp. DB1703]NNM73024.1 glutathione-regulated potassium-efflux system protein KefB [Enterovirga sp. DB1703]